MTVVLLLLGLFMGLIFYAIDENFFSLIIGAGVGALFGVVLKQRKALNVLRVRLDKLEGFVGLWGSPPEKLSSQQTDDSETRAAVAATPSDTETTVHPEIAEGSPFVPPPIDDSDERSSAATTRSHTESGTHTHSTQDAQSTHDSASATVSGTVVDEDGAESASIGSDALSAPSIAARAVLMLRSFFLGGNTLVRVGVVILLIGVIFLGKYAAEHALFPVEIRLAFGALIGAVLSVIGWRLRNSRPGYGTSLQGGGIAALYVILFLALKTYALVPPMLGFPLLLVLVIALGILAVRQEAMPLAVLGIIGGFLAPIIASTGSGNHVILFSYYTLLNLGIASIAFYRAWRLLNVLGFVFTFGIATTWGALRFQPELFSSTEPFLIIFFLLYVFIPLMYARRHTASLRSPVDGTLVFGTPLVAFGLQVRVLEEDPTHVAISAFAMGAFYILVARFLRYRWPTRMNTMVESFLALGIGFTILAVPFAVTDGSITSATWAIEGAGLFFIGVRQNKLLPKLSGIALQFLSAAALMVDLPVHTQEQPIFINGLFFASMLIFLGGLIIHFVAYRAAHSPEKLSSSWLGVGRLMGAWAFLWLVSGVGTQINDHLPGQLRLQAILIAATLCVLVFELSFTWLRFHDARFPGLLWLPLAALVLIEQLERQPHPFMHWGGLIWPLGFAIYFWQLRRLEPLLNKSIENITRVVAYILASIVFTWALGYGADSLGDPESWVYTTVGYNTWGDTALIAGILIFFWLPRWGMRFMAHFRDPQYAFAYRRAQWVLLLSATLIVFFSAGARAMPAPLPYFPLINPLEVVQVLTLMSGLLFVRMLKPSNWPRSSKVQRVLGALWIAAAVSLYSAMIWRAVHYFADVPYTITALYHSASAQTATSVGWSLMGLTLVFFGHRRAIRGLWISGTAVVAIVVLKLFLVDLAQVNMLGKIVSFLVVGVLLLLMGYFAPVPPERASKDIAS